MSSDKITSEQRKGIHDRGRKLGTHEGVRSGVNQLASYIGPEIGKVSLFALSIVLDATDQDPPPRKAFEYVDWQKLGAVTLEDLQLLTSEELIATQPNAQKGAVFEKAVTEALAVFNLQR
jgi:hypothetical protein